MLKHPRDLLKTRWAYDARPWACLALGLFAIRHMQGSIINALSGGLLVGASLVIFYMRNSSRYDDRRGVEVPVERG